MRLLTMLALLLLALVGSAFADDDFWDEDKIISPRADREDAEDSEDENSDESAPADIDGSQLGMYFGNGDEFISRGVPTRSRPDAPVRRSQQGNDEEPADDVELVRDAEPVADEAPLALTDDEPSVDPLFPEYASPADETESSDEVAPAEDAAPLPLSLAAPATDETEDSSESTELSLGLPIEAEDAPVAPEPFVDLDPAEDAVPAGEADAAEGSAEEAVRASGGLTDFPRIDPPVSGDRHVWSVADGMPGLENYSTYPAMDGKGGKSSGRSEDGTPPLAPDPAISDAPSGFNPLPLPPTMDGGLPADVDAPADEASADAPEAEGDDHRNHSINRPKSGDDLFYE